MSEKAKGKGSVRQPLTKGAAKVPVIMQMEALECGAACLTMVMAYYLPEMGAAGAGARRLRGEPGRQQSKNIILAARNYGFEADGYRMEVSALREKATYPCIIHWNFNHFVVLCGFKGDKAVINDPARGTVKVPMEQFDEAFTGICLQFAPGEAFVPGGKPKSTIEFARKRLKGAGPAAAFVMLTTAISYLFGLIDPAMTRAFYERLLTGRNPEWLYPFIGLMVLLCVAELVVQWINTIYSLRINGKMSVVGNTSYMWKVLHLPMEFFTQRMSGDMSDGREPMPPSRGRLWEPSRRFS